MNWISHGNNFEADIPDTLHLAISVGALTYNPSDGYSMSVYLGTKRVLSLPCKSADSGKELAEKWLDEYIDDLQKLRGSDGNP